MTASFWFIIITLHIQAAYDGSGFSLFVFFIHVYNGLAVIISALFTYPVSQLRLVALGAFHNTGYGQLPVSPARISSCL